MNKLLADQQARQQALDPTQSFIVQAPAGSGKTELLTQRYLVLLSRAEAAPEEIIAITFTRKAAAEMRERVILALKFAQTEPQPTTPHKLMTWQLAKNVLERDQQFNWQLCENPNRLRILTIDSLCATLCAQMPLLSAFGAQPAILDNPINLYEQAVEQLIFKVDTNPPWKQQLETLLLHLDNRVDQVHRLLTMILSNRDQWLPHIIAHCDQPDALKQLLEEGLLNIQLETMIQAKQHIPAEASQTLILLARKAGLYLREAENDSSHPIAICAELNGMPDTTADDFCFWFGIANMLLTKTGEWRKSVTKRIGFPAKSEEKSQMESLLAMLANHEALRVALSEILFCPPIHYQTNQWQIIKTLLALLPMVCAELNICFQAAGAIDFIELNLAAHRALGDELQPTDLALHLDYQIKHLLVDEFQDTSVIQFQLFEKLITGWELDDGRTVFLVGDPMQSIYRFRNAEVGLFLRAKQQGIGNIALNFLALHRNFRSEKGIVDWNNETFSNLFPKIADIGLGAVPYATSLATHESVHPQAVTSYPLYAESQLEASQIIAIINQYQTYHPDDSIAILVRSRSHLLAITKTLQQNQIDYQAVEIEPLVSRIEIQDLLSLTQALLHFANRIAWFTVLRAPWCGLKLTDIHAITQHNLHKTVWDNIQQYQLISNLSVDAKQRLDRIVPVITHGLYAKNQLPFSQWLKGLWTALGGPATLTSRDQLVNTDQYFKLIEQISQEPNGLNWNNIQRKITKLYAQHNHSNQCQLQIMTIHKAKGLEFDHVILPGLSRRTTHEKNAILMWQERPTLFGDNDLILAPIAATNTDHDSIYQYLRRVEQQKLGLESTRLLYVAATRAKKSLHLMLEISADQKKSQQLKPPAESSFTKLLWPFYEDELKQYALTHRPQSPMEDNIHIANHRPLSRLTAHWQLPLLENGINPQPTHDPQNQLADNSYDLELNTKFSSMLGTIIHESIQHLSNGIVMNEDQLSKYTIKLSQQGYPVTELATAKQKIERAIANMQSDAKGKWILQPHLEAHNEFSLSASIRNQIIHVIIDRCFIDEAGIRWIIDYKTAIPNNCTLPEFLQTQREQHEKQLNLYAKVMQQMEQRNTKCALYFPLIPAWLEWHFNNEYTGG